MAMDRRRIRSSVVAGVQELQNGMEIIPFVGGRSCEQRSEVGIRLEYAPSLTSGFLIRQGRSTALAQR
jgi:hypothetical protein